MANRKLNIHIPLLHSVLRKHGIPVEDVGRCVGLGEATVLDSCGWLGTLRSSLHTSELPPHHPLQLQLQLSLNNRRHGVLVSVCRFCAARPLAFSSWILTHVYRVQSLLLFVGPLIFTKGKALYQSTRISTPPIPLNSAVRHTLNILFIWSLFALVSTLPYFAPENIFTRTSSRLQTPNDVLFNRLGRIRPLTPTDERLRTRLQSKDGRLFYANFGPTPLAECNWCSLDEPNTWLWYALPEMALPHLLHIAVLGLVTSGAFSRYGRLWRSQATIAAAALFFGELYMVGLSGSDYVHNSMARSEKDVRWTHWRIRIIRGVGIAVMDGVLGYAMFLSGTRRWKIGWEEEAVDETIAEIGRSLERTAGRLQAGNFIKQTTMRDAELRGRTVEFWMKEEQMGREVAEDEEVKEVRMSSLPSRLDFDTLAKEASMRSEMMMANVLQVCASGSG